MKRLHALLLVTLGMLVGFLGGSALTSAYSQQQSYDYNQVVGRVGETTITRSRLAEHAIAQVGQRLLRDTLADIAVVEEEARKQGVTVAASEVKQRMDETFQFADNERARRQLEAVPSWLLEERIRTMMLVEKMMGITVSKNEVDSFYTENPKLFFRAAMANLTCIATTNRNDAQVALNRLKDGEDASKLSKQYSSDPTLREANGDIGWVTRAMMMPDAADAVFEGKSGAGLQAGESTQILTAKENGQQMYIIYVVREMRPNYAPRPDEVRPVVTFLARAAKFEERAPAWFKEHACSASWKQVLDLTSPSAALVDSPLPVERYEAK